MANDRDREILYRRLLYAFCNDRGLDVETKKDNWSAEDERVWAALVRIFNKKHPIS